MLKHLRLGSVFVASIVVSQQCCCPTLGCDELEKQDININDEQRQKKKHHHWLHVSVTHVSLAGFCWYIVINGAHSAKKKKKPKGKSKFAFSLTNMFTTDGPSASSSLISDKLSVLYALLVSRCSTTFPALHTWDGATYGHYLHIKKVSVSHRCHACTSAKS